jgi:GTP-binding protein
MMAVPPLKLTFVMSATKYTDLPAAPAELAIVGRSNVGKSSLINAVANRKQLALVSNTPGRTQQLNQFVLPSGHTVVDLPGYGYAKVPGNVRARWQKMIEDYLIEREELVMVLVLVDGEIGPAKLDIQLLEWLAASEVPFEIVATKLDKVKPSKVGARKDELARLCGVKVTDIWWTSASKGDGIDRLRRRMLDLLEIR